MILDPNEMLAVALKEARIGLAEGGVPVGGAVFHVDGTLLGAGHNRLVQEGNGSLHGETDAFRAAGRRRTWRDTILVTTLTPCWYCAGGASWLREKGFDIVDLHSQECIDMIAKFQADRPDLWKECVGQP
jgi:creatinine deaminase